MIKNSHSPVLSEDDVIEAAFDSKRLVMHS